MGQRSALRGFEPLLFPSQLSCLAALRVRLVQHITCKLGEQM
jgi:hypothetical protein